MPHETASTDAEPAVAASVGTSTPDSASATPHSLVEDVYAMFVGTLQLSLGVVLLKAGGLATGGVAGVSLVLNYLTGWPVGLFYAGLTVPLLAVTIRAMGWPFAIKTLIVTLGLFGMTWIAAQTISVAWISKPVAALVGGSVIGMGALALARHGAGTGGSGAVILWLYRTRGWNAGRTQMLLDGTVLLFSLIAIDLTHLAWSLLGVAATAGILYLWHRPGRYTGY